MKILLVITVALLAVASYPPNTNPWDKRDGVDTTPVKRYTVPAKEKQRRGKAKDSTLKSPHRKDDSTARQEKNFQFKKDQIPTKPKG